VAILDGGTTTLQVARHLPLDLQATIVTNRPPIALALAEHPQIEVMMKRFGIPTFLLKLPSTIAASATARRLWADSWRAAIAVLGCVVAAIEFSRLRI
jgi:DeoR C terminal sensor domain